jgi:hypothetical protein
MGGDFGGVFADAEDRPDIAITEVGGDAKPDELALASSELLELDLHPPQQLTLLGDQLDTRCRRGRAAQANEQPPHPSAAAMVVDAKVASDADQPGPEITTRAAPSLDTESAEEGLMGEVLGDASVANLAETEALDVRCVLAIQLGEFSAARTLHR